MICNIDNISFNGEKILVVTEINDLFLRTLSDRDSKLLWAKEVSNFLNNQIPLDFIYSLRITLENKYNLSNQQKDKDLRFAKVCDQMADHLIEQFRCLSVENKLEFSQFLILTEFNTECRITCINREYVFYLRQLKKDGNHIWLEVNNHLSREYVLKLLKINDCDDVFDKFVLSSEYRTLTKLGGLSPKHDTMKLYDVYQDSSLLSISEEDNKNICKEDINCAICNIVKKCSVIQRMEREVRIENFAATLYSFIDLLYSLLLRKGAKRVYFLAREGKFLKKLFDLYRQKQNYKNEQFIESKYLIVSRKSTYLPSLKSLEFESFQMFSDTYRDISPLEFLKMLNFSKADICAIMSKTCSIDYTKEINDFFLSKVFERIKQCEYFRITYEKKRSYSRERIMKYLSNNAINSDEKLYLVDSGWHGTIQDNIYKLFDGNMEINGFYIGHYYSNRSQLDKKNKKYGLLISFNLDKERHDNRYSMFYNIAAVPKNMEALLHSGEQSVMEYSERGEAIFENDYDEKNSYNQLILPLQKNILKFFEEVLEHFKLSPVSYEDYKSRFLSIHLSLSKYLGDNSNYFQNYQKKNNFTQ